MNGRRAFTLVELLVVIAIIALLVGVLLPTLGRARLSGQQAVSTSNLRQLQLANAVYANEHNDRYIAGAPGIGGANLNRWHGAREHVSLPFVARDAPIAAYLEGESVSKAVRTCPKFSPVSDQLQESGRGFEASCGGYGYNNAFVGTDRTRSAAGVWTVRDNRVGQRRSRFDQPTRTLAFATTAFAADELIEYSFTEPPRWPEFPSFRPDPSIHFRFADRAPVVWLDGHASSEGWGSTYRSGLYRGDPHAFRIGWFGDTRDNRLFDHD